MGNEPDLYVNHGYRQTGYDQTAYIAEFQQIVDQMKTNPNIKVSGVRIWSSSDIKYTLHCIEPEQDWWTWCLRV